MKICKRCIKTEETPGICFDIDGVCNYCKTWDEMDCKYPISKSHLDKMINRVKQDQKGASYDCVVGISGGCDSSYLLDLLVKKGLRCLGVHWDNNWNTPIAISNMKKVTEGLGVPIETYGGSSVKAEYDDICRAFLLGGTIDMDIPNDIALTRVLYEAAEKHQVRYIMNGHSFRTEGFTPGGWTWMDGAYVEDVHRKHGELPMNRYPNLWLDLFDKYVDFGIKRLRPLYHVDFNKESAKQYLHDKYGWEWYGGHHAENKYTKFVGNYMYPLRFGVDLRYVELSALVCSGQMSRDRAWQLVHRPPIIEVGVIDEVKNRLHLSGDLFESIIRSPTRTYREFKNYLSDFKKRLPRYWQAVEDGVLPFTFVSRVEKEKKYREVAYV